MIATRAARYGQMTYFVHDLWHGKAFASYGEWSEAEVALWRQIIKPGAMVLDVGAHIGAHTLALASLVGPDGHVHAFEPQRMAFQLLCANLVNNAAWNVTPWSIGLGKMARSAAYAVPDYAREGNFGGVEIGVRVGPVEIRPLDALHIEQVAFLKIDVEGMEREVLIGGGRLLRKERPVLYVENDRRQHSQALLDTLAAFGYRVWWHLPPLFNPTNHAGESENVFPGVVSMNLLALPAGIEPPQDPHLRELAAVQISDDGRLRY